MLFRSPCDTSVASTETPRSIRCSASTPVPQFNSSTRAPAGKSTSVRRHTAARMVRNYATELYEPAAASSRTALAEHGQVARDLAAWKQRVRAAWPEVKLVSLDGDTSPAHEGELRHVIAHVDIDGLEPESLTVQALHGPIDSEGEFLGLPKIVTLAHTSSGVWEADYTVGEAGPYGLTVRSMPSHPQLISPVEMGIIAWAN